MNFFKEFKDFAMKGNLIDIAVAFVMGGAFGKVVSTFTEGMIAPVVGLLSGKDLSTHVLVIKKATDAVADATGKVIREAEPAVVLKWGAFVTAIADFLIVAFVMFLVVKAINTIKRKREATQPSISNTDKLLMEIRDALKK